MRWPEKLSSEKRPNGSEGGSLFCKEQSVQKENGDVPPPTPLTRTLCLSPPRRLCHSVILDP